MVNNTAISNLIKERKLNQINTALHSGMSQGMHTLNNSLSHLIKMGMITKEEALKHSNAPADLSKNY